MTRLPRVVLAVALALATIACSDESPAPITIIPPTPPTVLTPDTGAPDGGSGNTTPDQQTNPCSDLSRAYYAAIGSDDGSIEVLQPLYDAVTPLLPEAARADWELAAPALIAYAVAAASVPIGDDQLDDPTVKAAYDEATSTKVQDALQRVRDAIETACPGYIQ
jgi:hypothetical protein